MRKKLFVGAYVAVICTFLVMAISLCIGTHTTVYAAEEVTTGDTESTFDNAENTVSEDSFSEVFKNDVLPLIISAVGCIFGLLVGIIPAIKSGVKAKQYAAFLSALKERTSKAEAMVGDFNIDNFIKVLNEKTVSELKDYISDVVKKVVGDNYVDNTAALDKLQTTQEILSAQLSNLLKGAAIAWKEAPGAAEALAKTPTAEVLVNLYKQVRELEEKVNAKNAKDVVEVDTVKRELEEIGNVGNE